MQTGHALQGSLNSFPAISHLKKQCENVSGPQLISSIYVKQYFMNVYVSIMNVCKCYTKQVLIKILSQGVK